jgi:carbamoyl-phosphate synthase large subunit
MARAPDYLDRFREVLSAERPDAVLVGTDVELGVLAGARLALEAEFGTHVLVSNPEVIRIADDKWLTYRFLRDEGLGYVPSCLPGSERELVEEAGFPLIVKPRIGARSIGVCVVRDWEELRAAIRPDVIIQKLVGADTAEYTAGTLTFGGRCRGSIVMRRDLRDGNTYRAYPDEYPELNIAMRQVAERLGAHGPANFQFRMEAGEPRIFEINARFSGTTPLRAHAGFDEVEMALRHLVYGEPIVQPAVKRLVILRHWAETVVAPDDLVTAPRVLARTAAHA